MREKPMTKNKQMARVQLREAADKLVQEWLAGKWDHLNLQSRPVSELTELFDELEKRCSGHLKEEYRETFRRSHWENR